MKTIVFLSIALLFHASETSCFVLPSNCVSQSKAHLRPQQQYQCYSNSNSCSLTPRSLFQMSTIMEKFRSSPRQTTPESPSTEEEENKNKMPSFTSNSKAVKRFPPSLLEELTSSDLPLPYTFILNQNGQQRTLCLRHLEKSDLPSVVRMCVKEFGSYTPNSSSSNTGRPQELGTFDLNTSMNYPFQEDVGFQIPAEIQKKMDDMWTMYENFVFAFVVQLGLDQRIERRQKSDQNSKIKPDHNVLALVDVTNEEEEVVGITEISLQPLKPTRTAPPFVLPLFMKHLLSKFDSDEPASPVAYVSNVLVKETHRGLGYGTILLSASEGRTKFMGYKDLYLHVDANTSGKIAQSLYWSMGYESYQKFDEKESPYAWMGEDFVKSNQGLVLVDNVPLLYLKKKLS